MRPPFPVVALAALLACGGEEGTEIRVPAPGPGAGTPAERLVAVRDIRVGSAADETAGVTLEAEEFGPGDTVFMSVRLEGSVEQAIVTVRWQRAAGGSVGEEERFLPLDGRRTVVFRLAPPAGLAAGPYVAELLLGGAPAGRKEFTVRG